jgi:hypothetical protein
VKKKYLTSLAVGVVLATACPAKLVADVIYDNSKNDLVQRLLAEDGVWFGDQVVLAGTQRSVSTFSFEYWAENTTDLSIDLKLHLNDGPLFNGYATPGTVLFAYDNINPLPNTDRLTIRFDSSDWPGGLDIPANELTLALRFNYSTGTAGVDIYDPPVVGSSYDDYWLMTPSGWQLSVNNNFPKVNIAMEIQAIPEPTAAALGCLGLGVMLLLRKRRPSATFNPGH